MYKRQLLHIAKTLNVEPSSILMIGDSYDDMMSGNSAGCATILLKNDVNKYLLDSHKEIIDAHVHDLTEVIDLIENGIEKNWLGWILSFSENIFKIDVTNSDTFLDRFYIAKTIKIMRRSLQQLNTTKVLYKSTALPSTVFPRMKSKEEVARSVTFGTLYLPSYH